jgi:uncharacterized hydrophobic protein (TIGR00271 family)
LLLVDGSPWIARFALLLSMSIVIASLGLASNQPAAVIAAMVVAPLMTPVLGIAASIMLGLPRQTARLVVIVLVSSLLAVAVSWLISATFVVHEVTPEELARTAPRLRDLVIALAAGAAGMYSVVRKDLSGVLPGVAIAVALVPPLATIGSVLGQQEWRLARGAALLYGVNVVAIVVAAIAVLFATDFVSSPSVRNPRVVVGAAFLVASGVGVIVPLWNTSRQLDDETTFRDHANEVVDDWAEAHPGFVVVSREIGPGEVTLVLAGPSEPPDLTRLRLDLADDDFGAPEVDLAWLATTELPAG